MRVDMISNPSQPTSETTAKTAESGSDLAGNFFAEIDRALNSVEQEKVQTDEKKSDKESEKGSDASEQSDLSPFLSAFLFSMQPPEQRKIDPKLDPAESSGLTVQQEDEAEGSSKTAIGKNGKNVQPSSLEIFSGDQTDENKADAIAADPELFKQTLVSLQPQVISAGLDAENNTPKVLGHKQSEVKIGINLSLLKNAVEDLPSGKDISHLGPNPNSAADLQKTDSQEKTVSLNPSILQQGDSQEEPASFRSSIDSEKKPPTVSINQKAHEKIAATDVLTAGEGENNRVQQNLIVQASLVQEASKASTFHLDAMASSDNSISTDRKNSSADSTAVRNENPLTGILKKFDDSVQRVSEEKNMGGSNSDQGSAPNEFKAMIASQNKLDSGDKKVKTSNSENAQERMTSAASVIERQAVAGNSVSSSNSTASSRSEELIYQVADKIQMQLRDGKSEIRIQLKPENLGNLEIRAASTSNGVVARITVESSSVKSYLENNLHVLQQTLQDQGLKVDRLQVAVHEFFDYQQGSGQSTQFGQSGSGSQGQSAHKNGNSAEPLIPVPAEEIAVDASNFTAGTNGRFYTVA
jgi:flagellar hook-length control protein FliK